ncbi:hypothetical protein Tco_1254391 [Tanacetum coccineum]
MLSSVDRLLRRNVPPFGNNRPSSNYGKGMKEQNGANGICDNVLRENIEVFAWAQRTVVPQFVMEHQLKIYPLAEPVVHKRRPMTPDRRQALKEVVFRWLKEGTIRKEGEELASLMEYPYKCFLRLPNKNSQIRMAENDEEKTGFHTEERVYCFTHMPKELKNSATTLQRMMEKVLADQKGRNVEVYLEEIVVKSKSEQSLVQDVDETLRKLKRVNIKIDPNTSSFGVEEGNFLGHMVTEEGVRADLKKVQTIIRSPTPKSPNQIRSLFLQLTAIDKFIPKLAELKYPINKIRMRMDATTESGWTREELMLCLQQRNETVSSVLMVEREGVQTPVSYVSRPLQEMEICYTPTEKMVQALIHTTRSLRTTFRKHKEAEGSVVKKFFGQGEQMQKTPNANKEETSNLSKKLQAKLTPTPRAWRLYLGKEVIKEGLGVGIILVSPDEKMHSYAIRLKFNAFDHAMDCEALLAGLVIFSIKCMKDLYVFIDSLTLVAQIEGNHMPPTKQQRKYKEEIMDATTPFHSNYGVLEDIVGFKRLQDILRVTAAQLQLLSDYYCWKDYADRDEIKDLSEKR